MNKFRALLVAAALLTAACGASTVSGSSDRSISTAGNVGVGAGANAGTNVAVGPQDGLARPNPPINKSGPVPVQQSAQPATTEAQPSTSASDRCSIGFGGGTFGPRGSSPGKHPPLPLCPVE